MDHTSLWHKLRFTIINKRKTVEGVGLQKAKTSSLVWKVMYSHMFSYTNHFFMYLLSLPPTKYT